VQGRRSRRTTAGAASAARDEKLAGKKATRPRAAGAAVPPVQSSKEKKRRSRALIRRRLPRSAAVCLTVVPGGGATTATVRDIIVRATARVQDVRSHFGIKAIRTKKTATGDLMLEIPGVDAARKADELASFLREVARDVKGIRITRPVKSVELRLTNLADSVSPEQLAEAISGHGAGCCADDVRVGEFRTRRGDHITTCWVRAPAVAGVPVAEVGKVRLGWFDAKVTLLKGRPLRCHRCLAAGHVQQRCPSSVDRSRCCYNCGGEDHLAAECRAQPHCPVCEERGKTASHRPGMQGCPPVPPARVAGPGRPLPSCAGAVRARRTGPNRGTGGAAAGTTGLPLPPRKWRSSRSARVAKPQRARRPVAHRVRRPALMRSPHHLWKWSRSLSVCLAPVSVDGKRQFPTTRRKTRQRKMCGRERGRLLHSLPPSNAPHASRRRAGQVLGSRPYRSCQEKPALPRNRYTRVGA